ncbi:unnamed protein product [Lampetra fluviatilis]
MVTAAKELKEEEEEKKKEWSAGAGDHKVSKWPFVNRWRGNRISPHKVSRPGTTAQTAMDRDAPVTLVDESMATSLTMSNSNITIHLAGTGSGNSSSGYPSQSESSKCLADSSVIDSSDDGSLHSDPCTPPPLQLELVNADPTVMEPHGALSLDQDTSSKRRRVVMLFL